ncbi:MAG: hypothetical protein JRF36_13790 [Deltaproteobacteria bacterium]|nr:hypothetical protein [Deltaproteobacteria bacterium]
MFDTVSKNCLKDTGFLAGLLCFLFLLHCFIPHAAALASESIGISKPLNGFYVKRLTASAFPIEIRDTIPQEDAGIVNFARVPDQTAVAVLVRAVHGIDLNAPWAVRFLIDDGYHLPYTRDLGHDAVRAVKLNQAPDAQATYVWLTYDRLLEPFMPTAYPLDAVVRVAVTICDRRNYLFQPAPFEFKIESSAQKKACGQNGPVTVETYQNELSPADGNDAGIAVLDGKLAGAKLFYSSLEPLTPELGDPDEIPTAAAGNMKAVGVPLNLLPHTVFDHPVQLFVPVSGDVDIKTVGLAYYDGTGWLPAVDADGMVLPGGEGWMVPGSRIIHEASNPPLIEVQVYHFSAAQAVVFARFGDPIDEEKPPSNGSNANVHISCFINSVSTDASLGFAVAGVLLLLAGCWLLVQRFRA